jgi:hypothetical protein
VSAWRDLALVSNRQVARSSADPVVRIAETRRYDALSGALLLPAAGREQGHLPRASALILTLADPRWR